MRTLAEIIFIIFFIPAVFFSCERNRNDLPDDQQTNDSIIYISYLVDNSKTVSASINSANGGSIKAEDIRGVSFELILPPNALQNNTTITMTPFKSLSISGAGASSCKGCGDADKNCCHHGIMLEPSGLKLDKPATLIVRYPLNGSFPFEGSGLIVYLDSDSKIYSSYKTETKLNDRTLTAQISHFSGYGTDETTKERLKREIIETCRRIGTKVGSDNFYWDSGELERLHWLDGFEGPNGEKYDDLVALLESLSFQLWSKQVAWELARSSGNISCKTIQNLGGADYSLNSLIGWHNGSSFATLRTSIRNSLSTALGLALQKGISLCQKDSCQAGTELLSCARSAYIGAGFDNPSLIESINLNLANCCKGKITLTADKTLIRAAALNRSNFTDCYGFITALVTGADGKPKENIGVWFGSDDLNAAPDGGTTDAEGKVKTVITSQNAGADIDENGNSQRIFVAHAIMGGEEILSEPITISFKLPMIDLELSYNSTYKETPAGTGNSYLMTFNINGTASRRTATYPSPYTCTANITRSFSLEATEDKGTVSGTIAPGQGTYPGCPFDIMSATMEPLLVPYGNYKYVYYIKNLVFYPTTIFLFDYTECHNPGECVVKRITTYSAEILPSNYVYWAHTFENNGSGVFPVYEWSNTITGTIINVSASLRVKLSIRY